MSDPGPVNFDADEIKFRIVCSHLCKAFAIAETDFEYQRRMTPEYLNKIVFDAGIEAILTPVIIQGMLLSPSNPALPSNIAADPVRKTCFSRKHKKRFKNR